MSQDVELDDLELDLGDLDELEAALAEDTKEASAALSETLTPSVAEEPEKDDSALSEESLFLEREDLDEIKAMENARPNYGDPGFAQQMMKDAKIIDAGFDDACRNQAALFAFYAEQSRVASKKELDLKLRIETQEGIAYEKLRNKYEGEGKKVTEKALDQELSRDPDLIKLRMRYNEVKTDAQMLRDFMEAMKQKRDMLIHLGLNRRDEKKGELRIHEKVDEYLAKFRSADV
jgi:hypothetical protein